MKILAVDTATTSCSVALFADRQLLAEEVYTAGKTHSRHLLSIIQGILDRCETSPEELNRIAVTRGPGTFTGLRIGISTVKGLAAALGVPVLGVSSLTALAYPLLWTRQPVVAMIDARRGEIYYACYSQKGGSVEADGTPRVAAPEAAVADLPESGILVGSGAVLYRGLLEERAPNIQFADENAHVIRAASVGRLALDCFDGLTVDSVGALVPEYIRKSDAQIQMSGSC